jgi:excisionase family DNA binding protein
MTISTPKKKTERNLLEDPLVPVKECARQLGGVSRWTVYSWLAKGKLRRSKVGGRVMVRQSELMRLVREGE